jgi:L-ascorbate metabolism protein UlaG (beta-lactamase superfamily)
MKKRLFKTIKVVGIALIVLLVILSAVVLWSESDTAVIEKYVKNENLPTVKADWKGTPVDTKGRFVNHEFPFLPKASDLLKWQLSSNPQKQEKQIDSKRLEVRDPTDFLNGTDNGILWLGHAGVFIRLENVNILVDPIFGKPPLVKTYVEVPSPLEKIKQVDFVLISHDHRDHADENTIRQIAAKFPNAKFLAGLEMQDILGEWKTQSNEVQTAGWFQQFSLSENDLKIVFVPVRHWCRRGLFDTNKRLWGGFVIQGASETIFLGGDSGFGSHYREVAEVFPQIDYFMVGIGAYEPRWFMEPNHNSPEDAWQAFVDSKARYIIPMHYGTFDLSDEPPGEPLRLLEEAAKKANGSDKIRSLQIFESLSF